MTSKLHASSQQPLGSERIGHGRLVLLVGPSGAGKDTLIALAREWCREDANIVFPRRIITRPGSSAEDHETVAANEFEQILASGGVALWWRAHGLSYALPRSVDSEICAGRTVVCNVSRTMVEPARGRYEHVCAVLISAPIELLAERLARRGREPVSSIADRLRRTETLGAQLRADFVIENVASPELAARQLMEVIYRRTIVFQD